MPFHGTRSLCFGPPAAGIALILMTVTACIDFEGRLAACRNHEGSCRGPELLTSEPDASMSCFDGGCKKPHPCQGKYAGQPCGSGFVCDAIGACVSCASGTSCSTNPNKDCSQGQTSCSTGASVCIDTVQAAAGTPCGASRVCNIAGTCVECEAGTSCSGNPSQCRTGAIDCGSGSQVCADGPAKRAGEPCGGGAVCDGAGFCGACTAGEACTTNPNACFFGQTDCSTGTRTCINGVAKSPGASCGANLVCDSQRVCNACSSGSACTTNVGGPCVAGITRCSSGQPVCADAPGEAQTTIFYRDSDDDGFGDPAVSQVECGTSPSAPAGFVDDKSDCCDRDPHAKPDQTAYFTQADACGSFDYDCSGAPELKLAAAFTGCTFDSVCAANGLGTPCGASGAPGWGIAANDVLGRNKAFSAATAIPTCGQVGTYVNGCDRASNCAQDSCACGHKNACVFDVVIGVEQSCH